MIVNFQSFYAWQGLSNKTLNWLPADTAQRYQQNLETKRDLLTKYNWIDRDITYVFNSQGFRCPEFVPRQCAMFLGCSHTLGVGLPRESTWSYRVAQALGMPDANLGIGGGSADTCFRMCLAHISLLKPRVVFYLEPPSMRLELLTDTEITQLLATNQLSSSFFVTTWARDDNNDYFNRQKNLMAIQYLCAHHDAKLVHVTGQEMNVMSMDLARDLMHHGESTHERFAEYVLQRLS